MSDDECSWTIAPISSPRLTWGAQRGTSGPHRCRLCGVILLTGERAGFCCGPKGQRLHDVAPLPPLPAEFATLLSHPDISKNSRSLNLIFSFASLESSCVFPSTQGGYVAIQGRIYHRLRPSHHSSAVRWLLYDGFMPDCIPFPDIAARLPREWKEIVSSSLL